MAKPFVARWDSLANAYRDGNRDPAPWIAFADDVVALQPYARESESVVRLSGIAATALVIAAELSIATPPHDARPLLQLRARAASLDREDRNRVERHVQLLLHFYLPVQYPDP